MAESMEAWYAAYIDGQLSPEERERFEAYVAADPQRQAQLDSLQAIVTQLRQVPQPEAPDLVRGVRSKLFRAGLGARLKAAFRDAQVSWPVRGVALAASCLLVFILAKEIGLPGRQGESLPAQLQLGSAAVRDAFEFDAGRMSEGSQARYAAKTAYAPAAIGSVETAFGERAGAVLLPWSPQDSETFVAELSRWGSAIAGFESSRSASVLSLSFVKAEDARSFIRRFLPPEQQDRLLSGLPATGPIDLRIRLNES